VSSQAIKAETSANPDWKVVDTGDLNGDGKSDLLFQNTDGSIAEWLMNGSIVLAAQVTARV
jgi:hypothetical protein